MSDRVLPDSDRKGCEMEGFLKSRSTSRVVCLESLAILIARFVAMRLLPSPESNPVTWTVDQLETGSG